MGKDIGKRKKWVTMTNLVIVVLGLCLMIAVKTIAGACEKRLICEGGMQTYMRCHYTETALFYIGFLLFILGLENFIRKNLAAVSYIAMMIILFFISNSTYGIGVCADISMACGKMKIFSYIIAIAVGIVGILQFFAKGEKEI